MLPRRQGGALSWLVACVFCAASAVARPALSQQSLYVLAIGANQPVESDDSAQRPLQFADDDAAAVYEFMMAAANGGHLLTVMDAETQSLYPSLAARSKPPTLAAFYDAVRDLGRRLQRDHERGVETALVVFFSGHGTLAHDGAPALLLSDAGLTKDLLYKNLLKQLPADHVHLLVDACHAEAVVRPRDADAQKVQISASEAHSFLVHSTLAAFPHVGAIVASSNDRESHEWSAIRHGVFTYELLSALRGAADVNRDRILEYSEVYAFMAAANRSVQHPGARLAVVARPPELDRRTPLFDLSRIPSNRAAWLTGVPHRAGLVRVIDSRGRSLVSLRGAADYTADLVLPAGSELYLHSGEVEAHFRTRPGQRIAFKDLHLTRSGLRARGYASSALQRGLFSTAYGWGYYLGYIDQDSRFVPVADQAPDDEGPSEKATTNATRAAKRTLSLTLSAGVESVVADQLDLGHGVQLGVRPVRDSGLVASLQFSRARDSNIDEQHGSLGAGYLFATNEGKVRGWVGAAATGGIIRQSLRGAGTRQSGLAGLTPITALSVEFGERVSTWTEVQYTGSVYREDGEWTFAFTPSAWIGAGVDL